MNITKDILYIGVNDKDLDLFEGQYPVPNGVSYNSYVIMDEQIAVMDTVDKRKTDEYMANLEAALDGRTPDYLVVHHAEPDHAASLGAFLDRYPDTQIVATQKALDVLKLYFDIEACATMAVSEGDKLSLGTHELTFIMAPMVHWPEVMFSYDSADKALFSADAFGKFGTLDVEEEWDCEARRYYFNIVGKFGPQVQKALKKVAQFDVEIICPLHGPILKEDLPFYLGKYETWSTYAVEDPQPFIVYASLYGNTEKVAYKLKDMLEAKGVGEVEIMDLARDDTSEALENAFRYGKLVLCAASLNGGVVPCMEDFLRHLQAKNFQNRTVALIENGSFGPSANRTMGAILGEMKDINIIEPNITIKGKMKEDDVALLEALVDTLA